jgi:hypothetical protein
MNQFFLGEITGKVDLYKTGGLKLHFFWKKKAGFSLQVPLAVTLCGNELMGFPWVDAFQMSTVQRDEGT